MPGFPTSQTKPMEPGKEGDVVVHADDHGLRTYESWIFLDGKWLDRAEFKARESRAHKFINNF